MAETITICIDWDKNGNFTTAGDDITADVVSLRTSQGNYLSDPLQQVAATGQCIIVVNNATKKYSPAYAAGSLYGKLVPGRPVRIQANAGGGARTIWYGVTSDFIPDPGSDVGAFATIICVDALAQLQDANISMPIQEGETPKRVLEKICGSVFGGATATGTLTYSATPANNDTVTVGDRVYTYKTTLTGAADEVLIGVTVGNVGDTRDAAAHNLASAINADTGAGTAYGTGTTRHTYITADWLPLTGVFVSEKDADYNLRKDTGYDGLATALQFDTGFTTDTLYLYLKKVGTPTGTMTVRIEISGGVTPSGILVDSNATVTLSEAALSTSYGWIAVTFPASINFMKYRRLFLVLTTDRAASPTNYVVWGGATTGSLAATKTGSAWTSVSGDGLVFIFNGLVSLTANAPGTWGNALALAETGTAITVSDTTLTGGTDAPAGLTDFATGLETIDAGDTWREAETNAMTAVEDIAKTEFGWLWVARDGKLTFKDRDWFFKQAATTATITLVGTHFAQDGALNAARLMNHIIVEYAPRQEATAGVVARLNRSWRVEPNTNVRWSSGDAYTSTTVLIPFIEASTGQVTGAKNVILPVPVTDYTVTDYDPSLGSDYVGFDYTSTGRIQLSMVVTGSGIEITASNDATGALYINDLQARGTPLISRQVEQIIAKDDTSITAYGLKRNRYQMPFVSQSGVVLAKAIAEYLLARYKTPTYYVNSLQLHTGQPHTVSTVSVFDLDIGEVVTLTEAQTGVTAQKHIISAIEHAITMGADAIDTLVFTRALGALTYWIAANVTYGVLGSTTRLGLGGGNYANGYADGNVVGVVDFNRALRDDANSLYTGAPSLWTHFHNESTVTNGNPIAVTIDTNQMHRFYAAQTAAADGDSFTFSAVLAPGWISVEVWLVKLPSGGKYKVVMDDIYAITGTEDSYAAAPTYNTDYVGAGTFYFTEMARHKFEVTVTGKHASSSGYTLAISHIDIWST